MGTEVQSDSYFPGYYSMIDLNENADIDILALYHKGKYSGTDPNYESLLANSTINGNFDFDKEQLRQIILKHESIFRHQLRELHRLCKRQRDLMHEVRRRELQKLSAETSPTSVFLRNTPFENANNSTFGRAIKENAFHHFPSHDRGMFNPSRKELEKVVFGVPVVDSTGTFKSIVGSSAGFLMGSGSNGGNFYLKKTRDIVDLNEPIQVEDDCISEYTDKFDNIAWLEEERKKLDPPRSSFVAREEGIRLNSLHSENKRDPIIPFPGSVQAGESQCVTNSSEQLFGSRSDHNMIQPRKTRRIFGVEIQEENNDQCPHSGIPVDLNSPCSSFACITSIVDAKDHGTNKVQGNRVDIDLNLCAYEEEDPMIASPDMGSTETKITTLSRDESTEQPRDELVWIAAETITAMSSSYVTNIAVDDDESPLVSSLLWFADVATSRNGDLDGETRATTNMDEFEFMTLNLTETTVEENYCYKDQNLLEESVESVKPVLSKKRSRGGKTSKKRNNFKRDVLPGLVTLSRHEVMKDLQTIEELCNKKGGESSLSRKNGARRSKRRERTNNVRERGHEEKSLTGWGKRIRRSVPRQRFTVVALKC